MRQGYPVYREMKFFGSLDGLRALSILGVIWIHCWIGTPQMEWLGHTPLLAQGAAGVDVFFTISGFLITTLLLRERDKNGSISLKNFYIRRALRIWPIYYGVLLLYVLLVFFTERDAERRQTFFYFLPTYATFTYTWFWKSTAAGMAIFNFAWSLSTEEQFYVFWPLVLRVMKGAWSVWVMSGIVLLRVLTGMGVFHIFPTGSLADRIILSIAVPICLGAILAHVLHHRRTFGIAEAVLGHRAAAPAALALLLVSLAPVSGICTPVFWASLPLLIGACVIREDHGLAAFLRWKPMAFVGVVSYGMYLYNTLVIKAVRPVMAHAGLHHPLAVFPIAVVATVAMAWLSYRYFESPFLALKNRFSYVRPAPAEMAPVSVESAELGIAVHP